MFKVKKKTIISLMGVDGSGKTTVAKKLIKKFQGSKYLHLKPYLFFKDRRTVIKNPHLQKSSSYLFSILRLLSWLISYKIFFLLNQNKKIYFFDRYAHDIIIDPKRYKSNLSLNLTKYILKFFPKPNLWIFLNPSVKTIKSRKIELNDNELKRQIKDYINFFRNKKNLLMVNTATEKDKTIKKISIKIRDLAK
jgi:thymidylate kinase